MSDNSAKVEAVIRDVLAVVRPETRRIDAAAELGLDSMQAMELIMEIEERLDISIPVESVADARTLAQLCASVGRLMP